MDVKDIILAASIAKGAGGGSSGGVTKEYVDTQIGAVSERVDNVEDVIPSAATPQNPLATTADVSETAISSTSTTSPITDSSNGMVQGLTVYGRSEVVEGAIKSIGDAGWGVVDLGTLTWTYITDSDWRCFASQLSGKQPGLSNFISEKYIIRPIFNTGYDKSICGNNNNNMIYIRDASFTDATAFKSAMSGVLLYYPLADTTGATPILGITSNNGAGQGTAATITTALPLRSTLDGTTRDELTIGGGKAEVITRCEVVNDDVVALATPVTTPLTDAEISAFRGLRTFDGTTNVTISDSPDFELNYLKNSDNGQAIADIQTDLQGQIDGLKIKTLAYTGTGSLTNTITFPEKPFMVLGITQDPMDDDKWKRNIIPFIWAYSTAEMSVFWSNGSSHSLGGSCTRLTLTDTSMSWTAEDNTQAFNISNTTYTVYYI